MHCQRAETPELPARNEIITKLMMENGGEIDHERLMIVHLDEGMHCIHASLHIGSESSVNFPFRNIIRDVLSFNSKAVIISHNHPSMICQPSTEDIAVTRKLNDMLSPIDVRIFDHFIFAGREIFSFRACGLL